MNAETMNKIADEVLESWTHENGKHVLNESVFLAFGKRIKESEAELNTLLNRELTRK